MALALPMIIAKLVHTVQRCQLALFYRKTRFKFPIIAPHQKRKLIITISTIIGRNGKTMSVKGNSTFTAFTNKKVDNYNEKSKKDRHFCPGPVTTALMFMKSYLEQLAN